MLLANKHTETEVGAFLSFHLLGFAQPACVGQSNAVDKHCVGRVRAALLCFCYQVVKAV